MSESEYTSLYEIIVTEDGAVALRQVGEDDSEPLVTIQFSEQSKFFLGSACSDLGRIMIEAGLDAVSNLESFSPKDEDHLDAESELDPIVH